MLGVYRLEIQESEAELKQLLRQQIEVGAREKVQLLYLLKTQQATTVSAAAQMLGRHRVTVQNWLRQYRQGGLSALLAVGKSFGRPRAIPAWAEQALRKRLQEPEGFGSYEEICQWLEQLGVKAAYSTVHRLVHEPLQARLKVPRPQHVKQSPEQRDAFKKELAQTLTMLVHVCIVVLEWSGKVRFFCGDETRIGLKTGEGRKITAKGVKPIGKVQWQFEFTYLF